MSGDRREDPGYSYPTVDLIPLRQGFLSSWALPLETGKVSLVPGRIIIGISVLSHLSASESREIAVKEAGEDGRDLCPGLPAAAGFPALCSQGAVGQ